MRNEKFITIAGWMVNELGLSGNELLCYALIYGFSQDGESFFCGSRKYIAELIGAKSLNTVDKYLNVLIEKGLLTKKSSINNGVISNYYKANLENNFFSDCIPPSKIEYPPSKIEHNNNSHIDSIKEERDKSLSKKDELFEQCWVAYNRKGSKAKSKVQWEKLSQKEKDKVITHIKAYVSSRELHYQQDFERYLKYKTFNDLVVTKNNVIYDPSNATNDSLFANNNVEKESNEDKVVIIDGQIYR